MKKSSLFRVRKEGSVLVFSLIILSVMLVTSLTLLSSAVFQEKSALSTGDSTHSFQVADSGADMILYQLYQKGPDTIATVASNLGLSCVDGTVKNQNAGWTVRFYDVDGVRLTDCSGPSSNVTSIKSEGTSQGTTRAVQVAVKPVGCGTTISVKDEDNNTYDTVTIGTQCWMKQNMKTTKYPDGSAINRGPNGATWDGTDHAYYAFPPNVQNTIEESTVGSLGYVYQWGAAMHGSTSSGAQGICPSGWHIPTHDEFTNLERALCKSGTCLTDFPLDTTTGGDRGTVEGAALSTLTSGGNNSSGFTALLPGSRNASGGFGGRGSNTYLWTSDRNGNETWFRYLDSGSAKIRRAYGSDYKSYALSVRCLKN
ncbi:MAG: hypothetical protein HGA31_01660 [Candidatus Moranbacteria bacterium]|nr:hypothetical protein [Candidatus Moranbacteria bacterium]